MTGHRFLGTSGLKVSELIFGNWLTHATQIDDEAARASVLAALDVGITSFDTADIYANTRAEEVLGAALKGQRRESLEIFTKVFWPTGPGGPNDSGLSRKHITESVNGSLRRLGTDYLDLYQAHRFDVQTPLEETISTFADLVRSGKILYVGVSEWTADQLRVGQQLAREAGISLISNQPQYSLLWRVIEQEVIPASVELGISQIVWSPLAQGVLTGKYLPGQPPEPGTRATSMEVGGPIQEFLRDDILAAVQELGPIAKDVGLTIAQLSLAWVLQNENVSGAIIGASRPEQVKSNALAAGAKLDREILDRIDAVTKPISEFNPERTAEQSPAERPS